MLCSTEGIVFSFIKFKESSIITKIYTKDLGLKSYIVNGVRSNKSSKIALFQPLSLLSLVVYNKANVQLNRISELKCQDPFLDIRSNNSKIFISIFISEILSKTIKEEATDEDLYYFIKNSLIVLDELKGNFNNYHLIFLAKLSQYLGFNTSSSSELLSCCTEIFTQEEKRILEEILNCSYQSDIIIPNYIRKKILKTLLQFYYYNIDSMPEIKSAKVLEEVLN